jgi:hypothetical protein
MTHTQLYHQRKLALTSLRAAQKDAVQLRESFLTERASLYSLTHNVKKSSALKSIKSAEKYKRQFPAFRTTFNSAIGDGITYVEAGNTSTGDTDIIREPKALQNAILGSNAERFHHHEETPCGTGIRSTRLGRTFDDSTDAAALLDGEYTHALEDLTPEARAWLLHLQKSEPVLAGKQINIRITTQDFVDAWLKYRESTASNPRIHYGHYKAAAIAFKMRPSLGNDEHGDPINNELHNPSFATVYAILCELPLRYGFAPNRWQMSINAMLVKGSGSL